MSVINGKHLIDKNKDPPSENINDCLLSFELTLALRTKLYIKSIITQYARQRLFVV